jgi:hypothetical protein
MSKAEDYRQKAADCATMAERTTDMRTRAVLLHMADVWSRLAAEDEASDQQQNRQKAGRPRTGRV